MSTTAGRSRTELDPVRAAAFLGRLAALPAGYSEAVHAGRRYGVTTSASPDGRRRWLYGEELGGTDRISCNVYLLDGETVVLRPCEMAAEKVVGFVMGARTETPPTASLRKGDGSNERSVRAVDVSDKVSCG